MSTPYKIFVILSILLVIGGGAALWLLTRPSTPTNTPVDQNPITIPIDDNSVTVPINSSHNTAAPDTTAAIYASLYQQLSATQLTFVNVKSKTDATFGEIYALYASDIADSKKLSPTVTDFSIEIASVDLDQDGIKEAVIYEDLPNMCGTGGCLVEVYKKDTKGWQRILSVLGFENVAISSKKTNGMSEILIPVRGERGDELGVVRFASSSRGYQWLEAVALWDGKQFVLRK